jgi:hypothetical protein
MEGDLVNLLYKKHWNGWFDKGQNHLFIITVHARLSLGLQQISHALYIFL